MCCAAFLLCWQSVVRCSCTWQHGSVGVASSRCLHASMHGEVQACQPAALRMQSAGSCFRTRTVHLLNSFSSLRRGRVAAIHHCTAGQPWCGASDGGAQGITSCVIAWPALMHAPSNKMHACTCMATAEHAPNLYAYPFPSTECRPSTPHCLLLIICPGGGKLSIQCHMWACLAAMPCHGPCSMLQAPTFMHPYRCW